MVAIYFDKEFIRLFALRNDHATPVVYDFLNQFIKKIRGVNIFINLDSLEELKEAIMNDEYYYYISEINSPQLLNFKVSLTEGNYFKDGAITKLFFVEDCNEEELQKKCECYFISNLTLVEKWSLFLSDRDDSELVVKSNPDGLQKGVFRSWSDLNLFAHLIKDILVFDLYILANKKDQRINNNILPCIEELIKGSDNTVNEMTIFSKELADSSIKKKDFHGLWLKEDIEKVSGYLGALNSSIDNISFVKYDESKNTNGDSEHNRFILTNYFYIRSEAGFNIFKDNGNVNNRDTIKFDSILKNRTRNIVTEILRNLKLYTERLRQTDTRAIGPSQVVEHYYYYPLITCQFLN